METRWSKRLQRELVRFRKHSMRCIARLCVVSAHQVGRPSSLYFSFSSGPARGSEKAIVAVREDGVANSAAEFVVPLGDEGAVHGAIGFAGLVPANEGKGVVKLTIESRGGIGEAGIEKLNVESRFLKAFSASFDIFGRQNDQAEHQTKFKKITPPVTT